MKHANGTQALAVKEQEVEQTVAPQAGAEQPAEPKLHSLEWFDAVIAGNEQIAAQKLAEFNQVTGAIMLLKQQRDMVAQQN